LGRIYEDRWDLAKKQGLPEARALLKHAIDAYLAGFEADWRDAYPGINAVTLMEMSVVRYSAARKVAKNAEYLGPRYLARACRAGPRRRLRRQSTRRRFGRGAGILGAGDHGAQSFADPRNAQGARRRCGLD
jgi:hypothetical protein